MAVVYICAMPETAITLLDTKDYAELIQVWAASVRATHDFLSEADILQYRQLILDTYFDQVTLFGISDSLGIAGFVGLDERNIQMLFIRPDVRGTGLGKRLVSFAIDIHGANHVDVNEQNMQAVGFYQKLGFHVCGRSDVDAAGKPYPILAMLHMPTLVLKFADLDDVPGIVSLYGETILSSCKEEYDEQQLKVWAMLGQDSGHWFRRIAEQYFLVGEVDGTLAGFASLSNEGYLDVFYVHTAYQRKGLASVLYQQLEKRAKSLSLASISADVSKTALPFFYRQGFVLIAVQQNELQGQVLENYKMEKTIGYSGS